MENFIEMIVDSIVPIAIILLVLWAEYRKRAKKDESRQVAAPLSRAAVADASSHTPSHTPTHTKPVSKPQRHLPVEGECAIPDYHPEPESEPTATSADTAELEAHYSRWRQALIDREVLETKF